MDHRRKFFKQSNLIEDVETEIAVDKNIEAYKHMRDVQEVNLENIREAHRIIMQDRQPEIAGQLKEQENYIPINARTAKVFTKPDQVREKIVELLDIQPETHLEALKWHINFENIHPFLDGNGRIGRMLYYHQVKNQIGGIPMIFRAEDKQGYYSLMNQEKKMFVDPEMEIKQIQL